MPISKDEVSYTYELDDLLKDVPEEDREDAAFDAGNAALGAVKSYMEGSTSPVSGEGRFKALSKDYKKKKRKITGNEKANLKLFGDLDEAMEVDADDSSFTISVSGRENTLKAYNHNVGDTLPKRQFLPGEGETFKRNVVAKIKEQIAKYKKVVKPQPKKEVITEDITVSFDQIFQELKASKREQEIAKNVGKITLKDIL
jgi:hypothetical protein